MASNSPKAIGPVNENETVTVRRIENGYIVSKSTYSEKSGYKSSETFSKTRPTINMPSDQAKAARPAARPAAPAGPARRAGRK